MMVGGPVMEYFKSWAENKKNMIVFVGYQAEGSLGRRIQKGWRDIHMTVAGNVQSFKIQMMIETVDGFSGHSDRRQLMNYINNMSPHPERIIFGHGEESKCLDISSSVHKKYKISTIAMKNLETIRFV
jgi:predicted metal-dependent RNase